jgi:hypothetical protein
MATHGQSKSRSIARRLFRTTAAERAFFAYGFMGYIVVFGAIVIFTIELTANVMRGSGTVSVLHFLVVGPLYVFLVLLLARALSRAVQRRSTSRQSRDTQP